MYGGNVRITAVSEIYEASVSVYCVSEGQITQSPTVIKDEFVTELYHCLDLKQTMYIMMFCCQLRKEIGTSGKVCLYGQPLPKTFPLDKRTS
jgi:hypothetical protein